jgi:hypothetical protein
MAMAQSSIIKKRRFMGGFQNGIRGIPLVLAFAVFGYVTLHITHAATFATTAEAESGALSGNRSAGDAVGASGGASVKFGTGAPVTTIINRPPQPGAIMYGDPQNFASAAAYAHPGALIAPGRTDYDNQVYKNISAAGGTVLIYLDVMINADYGKYHTLLMHSSACGPAVPLWPGNPSANQWGSLNDIRPGGILQNKLKCVLEQMVTDNPHMGGWFADDVGSRSWYPNINWGGWSNADQQAYRNGAIDITKTFRQVADEHGLVFIVNGTWGAGSLSSSGGGYPDMNQSGNALADGGVVEHHDVSELSYFSGYACSSQWASQSSITQGKSIMLAINNSSSDLASYAQSNCFAYLTAQTEDVYHIAPTPWTSFHASNLPSHVVR